MGQLPPFTFRQDSSKETGGTGLGLSIVKHSAMLHGAVIDMESKVGVGTVMTVSFVNGEAAV